jgi:hypothetical protein
VSGSRSPLQRVYDRCLLAQMRKALQLYQKRVAAMTG